MADKLDPKEAEKELIADIFEEGKLEDEEASMEASIKPKHDITDQYLEQEVAKAVEGGAHVHITENLTVGTDEDGKQYGEVDENVEAEG